MRACNFGFIMRYADKPQRERIPMTSRLEEGPATALAQRRLSDMCPEFIWGELPASGLLLLRRESSCGLILIWATPRRYMDIHRLNAATKPQDWLTDDVCFNSRNLRLSLAHPAGRYQPYELDTGAGAGLSQCPCGH